MIDRWFIIITVTQLSQSQFTGTWSCPKDNPQNNIREILYNRFVLFLQMILFNQTIVVCLSSRIRNDWTIEGYTGRTVAYFPGVPFLLTNYFAAEKANKYKIINIMIMFTRFWINTWNSQENKLSHLLSNQSQKQFTVARVSSRIGWFWQTHVCLPCMLVIKFS